MRDAQRAASTALHEGLMQRMRTCKGHQWLQPCKCALALALALAWLLIGAPHDHVVDTIQPGNNCLPVHPLAINQEACSSSDRGRDRRRCQDNQHQLQQRLDTSWKLITTTYR